MKRILVTGAAGFIGYHLCLRLLKEGHHVVGYDNFISGQRRNIQGLQEHGNFEFHERDITLPFDLKVDEIYNLACPASPVDYQNHPLATLKTSFLGAVNVLELATKNKAKVLQASTSEVYGDPLIHPQTEDYFGNVNPIGMRGCYDEGKRVAETLFFDYHRQYGTRIKVVRIFNTYGPHMRKGDGRVISNFINQALAGENLTIYGSGEQTRSFCYVTDLIDALILFMDSPDRYPGPVNIGNPEEVSILEIASLVLDKVPTRTGMVFQPGAKDDPRVRRPDIRRLQEIIDWSPKVGIREGLDMTMAYYVGEIRDREKALNEENAV